MGGSIFVRLGEGVKVSDTVKQGRTVAGVAERSWGGGEVVVRGGGNFLIDFCYYLCVTSRMHSWRFNKGL